MYALKFDAVEAGFSRDAFVEAMLAEGCFVRAGYLRPTYLEPLYQKKICFGKEGFPFSANIRNHEISYQKGICPICEKLQDEQLVITAVMQPPQTENDMTLFAEACEKVASNRSLLSRHNMKKIA